MKAPGAMHRFSALHVAEHERAGRIAGAAKLYSGFVPRIALKGCPVLIDPPAVAKLHHHHLWRRRRRLYHRRSRPRDFPAGRRRDRRERLRHYGGYWRVCWRCLVKRLAGQWLIRCLPEGGAGDADRDVDAEGEEAFHCPAPQGQAFISASNGASQCPRLPAEKGRSDRVGIGKPRLVRLSHPNGGSSQKPGAGMVGECIGVAYVARQNVDALVPRDRTHLEN